MVSQPHVRAYAWFASEYTDMTRSSLRFRWPEALAILGIAFGAWLIHNTFQPESDTPNYALLGVGAIDILLCFGLLGYLLGDRLRDNQPLPRSWIVGAAILIAAFLGWIAALFLDSDRILAEQQHHHGYLAQLAKLEDNLRHFAEVMPVSQSSVDRNAWQTNHDQYARLHDQLQASLKSQAAWDKELARIDEHAKQMEKLYFLILAETTLEQRLKLRGDFQAACERASHQAESLRTGITASERELAGVYRGRWHAVGASALTGVVLLVGCLLFWLLFDRELRRSWTAQARLADAEASFRSLIENHFEPIAVLDGVANILYANPAWQTAFHYELDDLRSRNLVELIHPQDRAHVQSAMQANDPRAAVPCRLSADYGVWHDVEIQCQPQADSGTIVVRIREVRESLDVPMQPQPELLPDADEQWKAAEARAAELENQCTGLRERESRAREDLQHQRWLLGSHRQANADGVLILSAHGEVLSWNPAFARLWKLSDDTLAGHSWQTIAAHLKSQVETGWDDFHLAVSRHDGVPSSAAWEMAIECDRALEVNAQVLRDHPAGAGAIQLHFRDITQHKSLETQLRDHHAQAQHWQKRIGDHEETEKLYDSELRKNEGRLQHLEKQLQERNRHREELEETLRDHQDRLHQLHETHEGSAASLKASKEATRRLACDIANEFNQLLSVVIGNADVLRENLPPDHIAQKYLDDISQAANSGTALAQRLVILSPEPPHADHPLPLRASA
ncbi:MAG: PAS domain S-box protein [Gemmataceae bacterium]|nr:PAS domain S-box protein [Gemmataceae bacterium]